MYTVLGRFALTEESIKDQFPGVKDWYNNTYYILRKVFIFGFTVEGAVIYTYYRMYVFILQERNFIVAICTILLKSRKALEFCQKSRKSPGTLQKVLAKVKKSPGNSWNLNLFFW